MKLTTTISVNNDKVSVRGKVELIDQPFILHIRAPRKVVQEG